VRQQATGTDVFTAMVGLVARSRRRYGGYIIHVGIVLVFLGFAGEGFKREEQVLLKPGGQIAIGEFTVRHDALRVTDDGQKQMITAQLGVLRNGKAAGTLEPAKFFYRKHEEQPTTEVAIRRGVGEDLYVVLAGYDVATQSVTLQVFINPLVSWIWMGFGVLAFGTMIALLPERAFGFAAAKIPAAAATTGTVLLLALLLGAPLRAAPAADEVPMPGGHTEGASEAYMVPKTPFERELQHEIICMCGTCGRRRIGECTCSLAASMRAEVAKLVAEGKSRDEVYEYFMAKYNSEEPLAAPIDKGFNRLAWALPYVVGSMGAIGAVVLARRWSHKPGQAGPDGASTESATGTGDAAAAARDSQLEERLADELRDLD